MAEINRLAEARNPEIAPTDSSGDRRSIDSRKPSSHEKVQNAAKQFESLLISQMMKSMREAGSGGWMGGGEDKAGSTAVEYAEEAFAQALASSGGLGLSRLIVKGLETKP
jgi:Rod binding domain-containing protein